MIYCGKKMAKEERKYKIVGEMEIMTMIELHNILS